MSVGEVQLQNTAINQKWTKTYFRKLKSDEEGRDNYFCNSIHIKAFCVILMLLKLQKPKKKKEISNPRRNSRKAPESLDGTLNQ